MATYKGLATSTRIGRTKQLDTRGDPSAGRRLVDVVQTITTQGLNPTVQVRQGTQTPKTPEKA